MKAVAVARLEHGVGHTASLPPCHHHTNGVPTRSSIPQTFMLGIQVKQDPNLYSQEV